jgi:hypothetical protein
MHVMFGSAHITGATASTPGDFSNNASDDEVHEFFKKALGCCVFWFTKKG